MPLRRSPYHCANQLSDYESSFCSGGCERDWYMYGNNCYRIMGDISKCDPEITDDPLCSADFGTAQFQCNELGADLVSIHNKYENGK